MLLIKAYVFLRRSAPLSCRGFALTKTEALYLSKDWRKQRELQNDAIRESTVGSIVGWC